MMKRLSTNQRGFTIIELLIATTVFSIILLVAASTLVQVGRMYYKGVITSKTQNVTRSIMDDVSRSIQFSNGEQGSGENSSKNFIKAKCFGNNRYSYIEKGQVDTSVSPGSYDPATGKVRHALWQDTIPTQQCGTNVPDLTLENPGAANPEYQGRALLENNMRLQAFTINSLAGNDLYSVNVNVIYYADGDLLNNFENPTGCKGTVVGGQWCAISDLSTVVYSRSK